MVTAAPSEDRAVEAASRAAGLAEEVVASAEGVEPQVAMTIVEGTVEFNSRRQTQDKL